MSISISVMTVGTEFDPELRREFSSVKIDQLRLKRIKKIRANILCSFGPKFTCSSILKFFSCKTQILFVKITDWNIWQLNYLYSSYFVISNEIDLVSKQSQVRRSWTKMKKGLSQRYFLTCVVSDSGKFWLFWKRIRGFDFDL